ncbi:hypothetical protein RKE30_37565 [Streptomyces sp. Li-HN-5-11]|uniref:hypothetical protein n=1 Tax=Streptomyces sp. Li-HN-5-11 TaxID=3075432 RepID=UPI0028B07959|nr:hypothetical protein [Streptomyces sp. Li-HN-5-11]WNM35664.1 hypothetical protein RKE30_37565 [Streptomyces sp. Li-HN-5-11]
MTAKRISLALAACAALAGVITALSLWLTRDPPVTVAGILGEVLVSADGRTITIPERWTPCHEIKPRLVARESGTSVTLVLRAAARVDLRHQCASANQHISTTLRSPLASRRLTDASTGLTINPFRAAQLATPRYLPGGYRPTDNVYADSVERPVHPFDRDPGQGPAWTRFYSTTSGQPSLSITQFTGNPPGAVFGKELSGDQVSVSGHPGHLADESPGNRSVIWSDGTYTFVVNTANPHLTNAQLLEIAGHLG